MVRRQSRGGGELLCIDLREREDLQNKPLRGGFRRQRGTAISVSFELEGQEFIALNGGPQFSFTPAISFSIDCTSQKEVDTFWDRLCEGGQPGRCGWLQDKFGMSWQVVPSVLPALLQDDDDDKSDAVMQAMLAMTKLDIVALHNAYDRA